MPIGPTAKKDISCCAGVTEHSVSDGDAKFFTPVQHRASVHVHHMDMANMRHGPEMYASPAMKRRVIFIDVFSEGNGLKSPLDDFDIDATRTPLFFVDVHLHTAEILQLRDTPGGTGWGLCQYLCSDVSRPGITDLWLLARPLLPEFQREMRASWRVTAS